LSLARRLPSKARPRQRFLQSPTPVIAIGSKWLLVAALLVSVGIGALLRKQTLAGRTRRRQCVQFGPALSSASCGSQSLLPPGHLIVAMSTAKPQVINGATAGGVFRMGEFLGALNTSVPSPTQRIKIEAPEVAMGNVVFLGPMADNRQMQAISDGRPFVLDATGIRNVQPLTGRGRRCSSTALLRIPSTLRKATP